MYTISTTRARVGVKNRLLWHPTLDILLVQFGVNLACRSVIDSNRCDTVSGFVFFCIPKGAHLVLNRWYQNVAKHFNSSQPIDRSPKSRRNTLRLATILVTSLGTERTAVNFFTSQIFILNNIIYHILLLLFSFSEPKIRSWLRQYLSGIFPTIGSKTVYDEEH